MKTNKETAHVYIYGSPNHDKIRKATVLFIKKAEQERKKNKEESKTNENNRF